MGLFFLLQVYLSYNNVSALKTLASQKKWRLSSEKDEVWDLSLFLVHRAFPFSFAESIHLVPGSPLQSWAEEHAELQGGYRGGRSRGNSLLSAGRTAQQAELGHLLSVIHSHCFGNESHSTSLTIWSVFGSMWSRHLCVPELGNVSWFTGWTTMTSSTMWSLLRCITAGLVFCLWPNQERGLVRTSSYWRPRGDRVGAGQCWNAADTASRGPRPCRWIQVGCFCCFVTRDAYVIALRSVSLTSHPPAEGCNRGEVLCAGFTIQDAKNNTSLVKPTIPSALKTHSSH